MRISDTLNGITKAKRSQARLLPHILRHDEILGQKVQWCGSWLHFREWIQTDESRLLNANFCKKHLLCQACAVRRAAKMMDAYLPKVESVCETRKDLVPAMVTLTMKNGPDLEERVRAFKSGWSSMLAAKRKAKSNPKKNQPVEWCKVHGSLRAIEVTYGKDGWHVHCHIFALLDAYIDPFSLSEEWHRFTGDSSIVDVRKCRGGIKPGLLEVLKYACKFSSMTPEQVYHMHCTMNGSRMIDPQGCLRGVPEPDIDSDDISGMTGPYRDFIATWLASERRYKIEAVEDVDKPLEVYSPSPRPVRALPVLPPLMLKRVPAAKARDWVLIANRKPAE